MSKSSTIGTQPDLKLTIIGKLTSKEEVEHMQMLYRALQHDMYSSSISDTWTGRVTLFSSSLRASQVTWKSCTPNTERVTTVLFC